MKIDEIASIILRGGVAAFPTETVYGLGALAFNQDAVKKIFDLKGRPADNPLIVHISATEQLQQFSDHIPEPVLSLIKNFWPGPLTLIFKKKPDVPDAVSGGLETVAVRMPAHPLALKLISKTGPLVAPSANKSGRPSPTRAAHVYEDFGDDFPVLDGGETDIGLESTVLDVTSEPYTILRPGKAEPEELQHVCGVSVAYSTKEDTRPPKSPGLKYTHYKPQAKVQWLSDFVQPRNKPVMFITHTEPALPTGENIIHYSFKDDFVQLARNLYDLFRMADQKNIFEIVIEDLPDETGQPLVAALKNRIEKAVG